MEILLKIIAILMSLGIIFNAYYIKRIVGTWFFPGTLLSLFWFGFLFMSLIILWSEPINIFSVLFIVTSVVLFSWTSVFFDWKKAYVLNKYKLDPSFVYNTKLMRRLLRVFITTSFFLVILEVSAQGISLNDMFFHPLITAATYAKMRYAEELVKTNYQGLSVLFAFFSATIGGLLFGSTNRGRNKVRLLFCFLPSLAIMITQGAKGFLFLSLFLFFGGLMVTLFHKKDLFLFKYKTIKKAFKISILLLLLLSFSLFSRGLQYASDFKYIYKTLIDKIGSYTVTHIYAFSDWFSAYLGMESKLSYNIENNYFGFYTFNFIAKKFVDKKKLIMGTYDEYFYVDGMKSNIYTFFRGLIMDFGILGALVFMAIIGFIIHFIFYIFLINKKPVFTTAFMIYLIGFFYMSLLISLLTWNMTVVSFIGLVFILTINKYKFIFKI